MLELLNSLVWSLFADPDEDEEYPSDTQCFAGAPDGYSNNDAYPAVNSHESKSNLA
ncbi:hypothetical protein BDV41DRAFT_59218 [Aspergillus transmontanensis]|uniref:Uncharacterized protein n=1 Tax=Aspergillus transmontanensis TaxID=1034304 RepID=A0A5N6W8F6_9EURO|nr:hypothetical protein BDV41DRAFT_59218 [Aspergillus transmontanensis]